MSEEQPTIRVPKAPFEKLGESMKQAIEAFVDLSSGQRSLGDEIKADVLYSIYIRLCRLDRQLRVIFNPESGGRSWITISCKRKDEPRTASSLLASIRATLDSIDERVAQKVPHRSSGRASKFHGTKRMMRADGEAIRVDFQVMNPDDLYRKWCCNDARRGVSGGQGLYTKSQVGAAIGHGFGGHLRRQRTQIKKQGGVKNV